jgi:hypothetical protein
MPGNHPIDEMTRRTSRPSQRTFQLWIAAAATALGAACVIAIEDNSKPRSSTPEGWWKTGPRIRVPVACLRSWSPVLVDDRLPPDALRRVRRRVQRLTPLVASPLVVLALLAGRPADAVGQAHEELTPGTRIRVHPESGCPQCSVTGRLELLEGGRLELRTDEELLSFPLDSIRTLEVSRGKSWVPPVVGGVGGFFLSTGIFLAVFCSDPDTSCDGQNVAIVALVVGAPVGGIGTF